MCARRFLIAVFFLTLLVVVGAFAIFQFGDRVLIKSAVPKGHFEAAKAGDAPDYAKAANWLARPGLADDPSLWLPTGVKPVEPGEAAVFYLHPTTYIERDRWNAPLEPGGETEFRSQLFVRSQSSAFNSAGRIWAPRYRQAAFGAFLLKSKDAESALDFAYRDVAGAFDQFVKEAGDRPIILAGHSQGALHLQRLLKEKVAGKPVARRVVAAYVVGWPISTAADLPRLGLPACASAQQTGCILSWMTFGEPANPDLILQQWDKTKGFTGEERRQKDVLCVNPITGAQNGAAGPQDNRGTLIPTSDMRSATMEVRAVGARCDKGLLVLDSPAPSLGSFVLPGNNYHVYDYALFWGAVRRDAEARLAAWRR